MLVREGLRGVVDSVLAGVAVLGLQLDAAHSCTQDFHTLQWSYRPQLN